MRSTSVSDPWGWLHFPNWVGFGVIILIGAVAIVAGALQSGRPGWGFIAFGIAAVVSAVVAWIAGESSTAFRRADGERFFGATVSAARWWVWLIALLLFGAAAVVAIVVR